VAKLGPTVSSRQPRSRHRSAEVRTGVSLVTSNPMKPGGNTKKGFAMSSRRICRCLLMLSVFIVALTSLGFSQGPPPPGPVWGRGPRPRRGACFYRDVDFSGDYFCMKAGQSYGFLPPGFNDRITSVQTFRARVVFFNDHDFTGLHAETRRSLSNLKAWRLPTDPRKTWNDRISSIQVQ
jgi:hypothetical protein